MIVAAFSGALAGVIHVLAGPDHLAAVSPLVAGEPRRGWRLGFSWGAGHAAGVWAIALGALVFKQVLPLQKLAGWSDLLVGLVLIGVGSWALRQAIRHRVHYHEHSHGGVRHTHFHLHRSSAHHEASHRHSHAPLGIGLLHGIAGGSHLIGVLPALLMPTRESSLAYALGYGLGATAAMTAFSWVIALAARWLRPRPQAYRFVLAGFAVLAMGTGVVWLMRP